MIGNCAGKTSAVARVAVDRIDGNTVVAFEQCVARLARV
jgi:hypothetical protein